MAAVQQVRLSTNDLHILNSVFDPESNASATSITIDASLPPDPSIPSASQLASLQARELSAIKQIEAVNPHATPPEKHTAYKHAEAQLSALIAAHPHYASAYNNRAQLRRWRFGDHVALPQRGAAPTAPSAAAQHTAAALARALADLDAAIACAAPAATSRAVSPAQASVLGRAWAQRGAVLFAVARDLARAREERLPRWVVDAVREELCGEGEPEWVLWERARLEEEGSRCFFVAGLYGSEVGKALAVVSNPYARLCGAIVREAVRGEVMR